MEGKFRYISLNGRSDIRNHGGTLTVYTERVTDKDRLKTVPKGFYLFEYRFSYCSAKDIFDKELAKVMTLESPSYSAMVDSRSVDIQLLAHVYRHDFLPYSARRVLKKLESHSYSAMVDSRSVDIQLLVHVYKHDFLPCSARRLLKKLYF
jgi:hypothetical protein